MSRRDCDCTTTDGRCLPTGAYQCFFEEGETSIVTCTLAGEWTLLAKCDRTCKTLSNDVPYCF